MTGGSPPAMVITLYADRRTLNIADIAGRLARALAPRIPAPGVVVATPRRRVRDPVAGVAYAPLAPEGTPTEVAEDLQQLASQYGVTLVAWSGAPNEQALAVCDASDRVLLVSDLSVPSIRATQRALKLCTSLGYGREKVCVVLQAPAGDGALAPDDAAEALKREIFWVIPGDGDGEGARSAAYDGLADRLSQAPTGTRRSPVP